MSQYKTYLFYDIETSGLNKCFDQVMQFAAIRTDLELNELERHEILVKLNPDTIASPYAVITHQIPITKVKNGLCEYEAIRQIHKLLNTTGTISLGYNTLGFDDEFLRFSFHKNLLTPYTHQYANNCSRMDLYPIAAMYHLFKPDNIIWPKINNKTTLKLEHLSSHNNLAIGQAHDAITDVEATVALAKLFYKESKMWAYLCECFDKKIDIERTTKLDQALLIEGTFGAEKFYQCPVISLGMHNHYKNQSLWLQLDTPEINEKTFVYRKRFGEQPLILPLALSSNSRFDKYLSEERKELINKNLAWIQNNQQIFGAIAMEHKEYKYPIIPNVDIDAALYQNGFLTDQEQKMCNEFHLVSPEKKVSLVNKFNNIKNKNLRTQAIRILGRNYPDVLPEEYLAEFRDYLQQISLGINIIDYKNTVHITPKLALEEIEKLKISNTLNSIQLDLLEQYATDIIAHD